jgi:hypothetical protein
MKFLDAFLALGLIVLVAVAGCTGPSAPAPATTPPSATTVVITTLPPTTIVTTVVPTPTPEPFPGALPLHAFALFGNGTKWTTDITVYKVWINDTYQWWSPDDNRYYTQVAPTGKKYLIAFVDMVNRGTDRAPLPPQANLGIIYASATISPDPGHILPNQKADSPPSIIRIGEIEFVKKMYASEYVEDFGYSHGQKLGYITPGESNAVDGYIVYEVPATLTPQTSYLRIVLPGQDPAIWILG